MLSSLPKKLLKVTAITSLAVALLFAPTEQQSIEDQQALLKAYLDWLQGKGPFTFNMTALFPPIQGTPTEEEQAVCGVFSNGTISYEQNGTNWCGFCKNATYQQSPIDLPELLTLAPVFFDLNTTIVSGDMKYVWVDVADNWVQVHYKSDGYMKFEGLDKDYNMEDNFYRHMGLMRFHTPAEHTFRGENKYDVELEIFFKNLFGDMAVVSIFFDKSSGSTRRSAFLDELAMDATGVKKYSPRLSSF